jgi:hypothetical protein
VAARQLGPGGRLRDGSAFPPDLRPDQRRRAPGAEIHRQVVRPVVVDDLPHRAVPVGDMPIRLHHPRRGVIRRVRHRRPRAHAVKVNMSERCPGRRVRDRPHRDVRAVVIVGVLRLRAAVPEAAVLFEVDCNSVFLELS